MKYLHTHTHTHTGINNAECCPVCLSILCPNTEQALPVVNNLMEVTVTEMSLEGETYCIQLQGCGGGGVCLGGCSWHRCFRCCKTSQKLFSSPLICPLKWKTYAACNSDFRLFPLVTDSDRAGHLCQGDQLWLSCPSWEAHHCAGPQRHPRFTSFHLFLYFFPHLNSSFL